MASKLRQLKPALMFLTPNLLGVLAFTIFPVLFSILLAFTNWDLRLHNMFKDESLQFVGFDNFIRLFTESDFPRFLGNTLFLMMGIPLSVGGSLFAAMLLSSDTRGGSNKVWLYMISSGVLAISVIMLLIAGMGSTAMLILLVGVACGILLMGMTGGLTVYRTLFYTPHFVMGVPTYILWKKLYNPETGPINAALQPVLDQTAGVVNATSSTLVSGMRWFWIIVMVLVACWALDKFRRMWRDGELASRAVVIPVALLFVPIVVAQTWPSSGGASSYVLLGVVAAMGIAALLVGLRHGQQFAVPTIFEGAGNALVLALAVMTLLFICLGMSVVFADLPAMASDGLEAPKWLADYYWAKPALMIVGIWGAIGSNNMLLYLAALTNVPGELYEAADIDGARMFQRFWHVTWPQLAPTTFFILVMSTIYGLQGGFEMARTMTQGGPAGATTTMSYFIYLEGFETGRLSFAAAVAWALFILVFGLTMINWKFGNKYVND